MPHRMTISITSEDPPTVSAKVYCYGTGRIATIAFLVDTGAFDISLSEDAANQLGAQ